MDKILGIDISHWQGKIDFERVKKSGIQFVILKAGGSDNGFYEDKTFRSNYEAAKKAGIDVGAYYFVGKNFYGVEAGVADAKRFCKIIGGCRLEYPVFLDVETTQPTRKEEATEAAIAFCEEMENNGYYVGIYSSDISGFREKLNHSRLTSYTHWVADYNDPVAKASRGESSFRGKGSAPGCIPKLGLPRPD